MTGGGSASFVTVVLSAAEGWAWLPGVRGLTLTAVIAGVGLWMGGNALKGQQGILLRLEALEAQMTAHAARVRVVRQEVVYAGQASLPETPTVSPAQGAAVVRVAHNGVVDLPTPDTVHALKRMARRIVEDATGQANE